MIMVACICLVGIGFGLGYTLMNIWVYNRKVDSVFTRIRKLLVHVR